MALRTFLIAAAVFGCCLSGCVKKSGESRDRNAQVPATGETAKADSQTIFEEFYKDAPDTGRGDSKTFSMNSPPEFPSESYTPKFSKKGRYTVQISSQASRWLADELATQFKEKGYPAYVATIEDPTDRLSGTFYRVRIGGFATINEAKMFGEKVLKPSNYDYWIDRQGRETTVQKPPAGSAAPPPAAPAPTAVSVPPSPPPDSAPVNGGWQNTSPEW